MKSKPLLNVRRPSNLTAATESRSPVISSPQSTTAVTRKLKFIVGLKPLSESSSATFKTSSPAFFELQTPTTAQSPKLTTKPIKLSKYKHGAIRRSMQVLTGVKPLDQDELDEAKQIRETLMEQEAQEKLVSEDTLPQDVVGLGAARSFYLHYKKLGKVRDTNAFTQTQDSTYTSFLSKTESLNLLPTKLGFIREAGVPDKLQLNHFRMGDKYAEVLSEGLKSVKGFNKLELANNRLTPSGATHILSKLTPKTEFINLSANQIGKIGCNHLCNLISSQSSQLLELNLEGNKLGDVAVGQLCEAINYNNSLKKLNIGKNFLTSKGADKVCRMLEMNTSIEELYLQWNQLKGAGGACIVAGLKSASQLRVLDLSWNSLGLNGTVFAKAFGPYIGSNTTLVHLDLSSNYLNKADSKLLAEDLKNNHSLYGIHYQGNTGYIDCKGFLVIPDEWDPRVNERIIHPPINGVKYNAESLKHHLGNSGEYKDVCWVCEGWRVGEINWGVESGNGGDEDPVYAHLSHEGYKSLFLPSKNEFKSIRMVPPNAFQYFFSIDGSQIHAVDQPFERARELAYEIELNKERKFVRVENLNYMCKSSLRRVLDDDYEPIYELKSFGIKPRVPDEEYVPPENAYERQKWKLACSIFRNSKQDSQALLDDCFKVDFEGSRITKLIKNADDLASVREILHSAYKHMKDCYKHYASIGAPSDIWCIPLNTYTEFCNNCGIIDGKILKLSDFDRIFIATYTKTDKERNPRNPDRALVRFQFMEGLVRIAEQKYLSSGQVQTYTEALTILMEENVIPFIAKFDHQKWGPEKFWNENVDVVLKSYLPVIRGIFRKYSGQKTVPGQKKFMCIEEFNKLMNDGDLFSDHFNERDAVLAFNLSMTTQLDELNSDRIFQMNFMEFLEAFARATDKISPGPYSNNSQPPQSSESRSGVSYEQKFSQPLHIKLEGMMPLLWSLCGSDVKDVWVMPETSIFEMEEVNPKVRYTTKKKKIVRINPTLLSSIEPYEGVNALQI